MDILRKIQRLKGYINSLLLDIEKVLSAQDVVDIQSVVESADIAEAESESNRSHPKKGVSKETKERRRDHVKRSQ